MVIENNKKKKIIIMQRERETDRVREFFKRKIQQEQLQQFLGLWPSAADKNIHLVSQKSNTVTIV